MSDLNVYSFALISMTALTLYVVWSLLRKPSDHQSISSRIPSITKSLWSQMKFSLIMATKDPKDLLPYLTDLLKNNGPLIRFKMAGRSYVILNDPEYIKIILSSTRHISKGPEYKKLKPWLNDGLLLSTDSKWYGRRKLLAGSFHLKTLNAYNAPVNRHSRVLVRKLLEASANNDKGVSIAEHMTLCSLDMICETIMGIEINVQEGKSIEYVKAVQNACSSVIDRVFKFWLWNDQIFKLSKNGRTFYESIKVLHEFTDNVIRNKKNSLKNSENQKVEQPENEMPQNKSFLDILLNALNDCSYGMTDDDIREEVDTFLFEGHDTSSIAMTMTLVLLGLHQDIQDRARDEIFDIFGDSDRDVTMEDLNAMKYVEAVIKESLRLYPSVPAITRELHTALQLKNYCVPPTTTIVVIPYILHRSEEIFSNPEEFLPERFLDDGNKSKYSYGYIPFSAGPRNCIGQKFAMNQMKIVVSTVLRKAKVKCLGNKEDIQISMQIVTRLESLPKLKFYEI